MDGESSLLGMCFNGVSAGRISRNRKMKRTNYYTIIISGLYHD